jgi:SAM-dependent methyltransferase
MKSLSHRRDTCRLCGGGELELVLPLRPSALADAYVPRERIEEPQPAFPLEVFHCRNCGHVQLLDVVDADVLFRHYLYTTSGSLGLVEHFRKYAAEAVEQLQVPPGSLVVDIGSNEGVLLKFFREHGMRVLGVDAAKNVAALATAAGVETLPEFFTAELARQIKGGRGSASVVTANNVFAHADGLADMADGIRELLTRDGVFLFEVIYLVDLIQKMTFDTIYHEHLCYHSVKPLRTFFRRHGMELFDVKRIPTKGGSIRGFAQPTGGPRKITPAVGDLIGVEEQMGLDRPEAFRQYGARLDELKRKLKDLLQSLKRQGKTIAGYGASATVTTLVHHFELAGWIDFIVDDNPDRQNLFSPGDHIPVLSPAALSERKPDYVLILAWQYSDPIIRKNQAYLDHGGHFIRPLPEVEVR